jgi:hypothetical protein
LEKSVLSDIKGEKPNDNNDPSTNKNLKSELNMMGLNEGNKQTNEDKYMGDNSISSKLSVIFYYNFLCYFRILRKNILVNLSNQD